MKTSFRVAPPTTPRLLAIDPGSRKSGWTDFDSGTWRPEAFAKQPNERVRDVVLGHVIAHPGDYTVAIEEPVAFGGKAWWAVGQTQYWIGCFCTLLAQQAPTVRIVMVKRDDVKRFLLGRARIKDMSADRAVRAAIIRRFGRTEKEAIGTKKDPGPLYGMKRDMWAATGVGLTLLGGGVFVRR